MIIRSFKSILDSSRTKTFTSIHLLRFITNTPETNHFTVNYLKNKCGLSSDSAIKASKHMVFKSTTKPDSILFLLKSYGFTDSHISKLLTVRPQLLLADSDTNLKPKLDFLTSIGICGPDLGNFLVKDSSFLISSLEKRIIPSIDYLRSLVHTDDCVARVLKRSRWGIQDAEGFMGPNIAILRNHGVPDSLIKKLLLMQPRNLFFDSEYFKQSLLQLREMGFSPSSMKIIYGLHVLMAMSKSTWDEKLAVFRSFGWLKDEVLSVFKKHPVVMATSAKKIKLALDFFMNTLKWTREDISRNPVLITLSLDKRIIPRCYVFQTLLSQHLINEKNMGQALIVSEGMFLKKYVSKYHHQLPDLPKVYQNMLDSHRISVGAEDGHKMAKI